MQNEWVQCTTYHSAYRYLTIELHVSVVTRWPAFARESVRHAVPIAPPRLNRSMMLVFAVIAVATVMVFQTFQQVGLVCVRDTKI